ncbi:MAG: hypothetical protein RSC43_00905 [Clostridia bacterium]
MHKLKVMAVGICVLLLCSCTIRDSAELDSVELWDVLEQLTLLSCGSAEEEDLDRAIAKLEDTVYNNSESDEEPENPRSSDGIIPQIEVSQGQLLSEVDGTVTHISATTTYEFHTNTFVCYWILDYNQKTAKYTNIRMYNGVLT